MRRLALLVALALPFLPSCSGGEAPEARFDSAEKAPAGALPAWVPPAASEVHLRESPKTKALWVRFRLPEAARAALEKGLVRIPDGQIATLTVSRPPGADWWFRRLAGPGETDASAVAADVFSGSGTGVPLGTFVAFERGSDRVYAWRLGR